MAAYNPAPIPESDTSPLAQTDPAGRVQEKHASSAQGGSYTTAQDQFAAKGQQGASGQIGDDFKPAPPSQVADYDYPNVPDTTEPQQAATGPGQGKQVEAHPKDVPFKEQVNGYAKKIAGTVFNNPNEKEFGEKKLQGQA